MQMYLASRLRGPFLASHGVYHGQQYFEGVTGLRTAELMVCKETESYVRTHPYQPVLRIPSSHVTGQLRCKN